VYGRLACERERWGEKGRQTCFCPVKIVMTQQRLATMHPGAIIMTLYCVPFFSAAANVPLSEILTDKKKEKRRRKSAKIGRSDSFVLPLFKDINQDVEIFFAAAAAEKKLKE
jgi:hypothetical protein